MRGRCDRYKPVEVALSKFQVSHVGDLQEISDTSEADDAFRLTAPASMQVSQDFSDITNLYLLGLSHPLLTRG